VVLGIWQVGLFADWRLRLTNYYYVSRPTEGNISIVALDDASLQRFGRSLTDWPRAHYADLIRILDRGGARVVAFDVLFAEPSDDDPLLVEAIVTARNSENGLRTVMPAVGLQSNGTIATGNTATQFLRPVPELVEVVDYLGTTNVTPNVDGAVRAQTMRMQNAAGDEYLTLSAASYLAYLRIPEALAPQVVEFGDETLELTPQRQLPINDNDQMLVNFFGPPGDATFPVYSMIDVLDGEVPLQRFEDQVVFIGLMNSTGQTDLQTVPISIAGAQMAGVEIQANTLETIMQENAPRPQSANSQAAMIVVLALVAALVISVLPRRGLLLTLPAAVVLLALGVIIGAGLVFSAELVRINVFDALLAVVLPIPAIVIVDYLVELRLRRQTELLRESMIRAASQDLSLADTLQVIARDFKKMMRCTDVHMWLQNDDTQQLEPAFPATLASHQTPDVDMSVEHSHANRVLTLPLVWRDALVGVLVAHDCEPPSRGLMQRLRPFVLQSTSMIANARLYAASERLSDTKTRMIRMASHDLKNPLGVITGYLEILMEDAEYGTLPPKTRTRFLRQMNRASKEMLSIVQDILDLERMRRGVRHESPFNLTTMLTDLGLYAQSKAEQNQQLLQMMVPDAMAVVVGDEKQIRHAFSNLIDNALKYTPENGEITVRFRQDNHTAYVEVQDNGYGIPKDVQHKLFQEFYRVRSDATAHIEGTGLGLSLVKAVISAHNGLIRVESEEGVGSTFFVELPLASETDLSAADLSALPTAASN